MDQNERGPALGTNQDRARNESNHQDHNTESPPVLQVLAAAMAEHGLDCPADLEPGRFQRFPGAGKSNGNEAGWCKIFDDGAGAVFGDYSSGLSETCWFDADHKPTAADRQQIALTIEQAKTRRKEGQDRAAEKARKEWESAFEPEESNHPYLTKKGVPHLGTKQDLKTRLLVPIRNPAGELRSIQHINYDGAKRFFPGGEITGCYHAIGRPTPDDDLFLVCEGYATGASLRQSCAVPVAVAFNAGNLKPVAEAIRQKFPDHKIVVCADDDHLTEGNPGLAKAKAAAAAVGGYVAVPDFGDDRPAGATDFNDLELDQGGHAVLYCIQAALAGETREATATPKPRRLTFTPAGELTGPQEPTAWTVKGFIEAGNLLCFFAPPESLKTFVLLDIGLCIATGKDWHGHRVTAGPVLYVCGEGRRGIGRRLQAWEKHHGVKADLFFVSSVSAALLDPASLAELEEAAEEVAEQHGKPALIIIDTLNRNFGPGDENSTTDMTRFIASLDKLRERLQCAVAVVHHTGLADTGRGRGNSSLRGALDFEYTINRSQGTTVEDRTIELACSKAKDHDRPPTIAFQPVVVDLGFTEEEGQPVTSLALDRTEKKAKGKKLLTESQRQGVAAFWCAAEKAPTLDDDGSFLGLHLEDWRPVFYEISTADNAKAKKVAFQRLRKALVTDGMLTAKNDIYRMTTPDAGLRARQIEKDFAGIGEHLPPAEHQADNGAEMDQGNIDFMTGEILENPVNTGLDDEAEHGT